MTKTYITRAIYDYDGEKNLIYEKIYKGGIIDMQISEIIDMLNNIKKDEVDERTFYEDVLCCIQELVEHRVFSEEEHKMIKNALLQAGCKSYAEWKEEKEQRGIRVPTNGNTKDGSKSADIRYPVWIVGQFLGEYENAKYSFLKLGENDYRNEMREWVENSLKMYPQNERKESDELAIPKSQIPYYQVAKKVLMADWNGYSEQEAIQFIESHTFDEIEAKVNARGSMDHAIEKISQMIEVPKEELEGLVYHGEKLPKDFYLDEGDQIDVLFAVHDGWVRDYPQKFLARDKKYQHMPSELIGWDEAKLDLLFVAPIIEKINRDHVNEEYLGQSYDARVREFFLSKGIKNADDLTNLITKGADFYPALEGYPAEVLESLANPEYVRANVVPSIETKGIGNIQAKRASIIPHIAEMAEIMSYPGNGSIRDEVVEDLGRLTEKERDKVKQIVKGDAGEIEQEREQIKNKNDIISDILTYGKRAMEAKLAIAKKQHREKNNNINGVGE